MVMEGKQVFFIDDDKIIRDLLEYTFSMSRFFFSATNILLMVDITAAIPMKSGKNQPLRINQTVYIEPE